MPSSGELQKGRAAFMPDPVIPASRQAALARLARFLPDAGSLYNRNRNTDASPDDPGGVSRLSAYVRHRMITEHEIVAGVLAHHSLQAAEKFVQEVLWRTYWKGWLEMRPTVWTDYLAERDRQRGAFPDRRALTGAENGHIGIDGFDDWARELVATGYLHNHARMWFASIWIFTLRLPWALGADFFLRHLVDADPASNTLSWRWVAGLQTPGKTYLATPENITRFTNGRFAPSGLAREAVALSEPPVGKPQALPALARRDAQLPSLLLVTGEDMNPESAFPDKAAFAAAIVIADPALSWGDQARDFATAAAQDAAGRCTAHFGCPVALAETLDTPTLVAAAHTAGVRQIVTAYAPVGPTADRLARLAPELAGEGIKLVQLRRDWDDRFWPHATRGYFPFRERLPALLLESGLA